MARWTRWKTRKVPELADDRLRSALGEFRGIHFDAEQARAEFERRQRLEYVQVSHQQRTSWVHRIATAAVVVAVVAGVALTMSITVPLLSTNTRLARLPRCHSANLKVEPARDSEGAVYDAPSMGSSPMIMEFVNMSTSTCELTGAPPAAEATFGKNPDTTTTVKTRVKSSFSTGIAGEPAVQIFDSPVELAPGQGAAFAALMPDTLMINGFVPPGGTGVIRWNHGTPSIIENAGNSVIEVTPVFPPSQAGAILSTISERYPGEFTTPYTTECSPKRGPGPTILHLAKYEHWSSAQVYSLWHAYCNMLGRSQG